MTITVGLIGAGNMGVGIGWALREGGARVVTSLEGRSARTARLVEGVGLATLATFDELVSTSDVLLSVVPPASALDAAREVAASVLRNGSTPLYADLNAIAPPTMYAVGDVLAGAGVDTVDGSISGGPPNTHPGTTVYFSGPRAAEVAGLPWRDKIVPTVVSERIGTASAVKMCTASVYKGLAGLMVNALATAATHDVVDIVVADLGRMDPTIRVAMSASKSARFVGEMHEIAATQGDAGLSSALFEAMAELYEALATTELAGTSPEDVDLDAAPKDVVRRLRTGDLAEK